MSRVLIKIYQLPIIGDLICYIAYAFLSLFGSLSLWLSNYKRMNYGTSVIWAPKNKKQAILDSIECLRNQDAEMFLRLTEKQRLFIYGSVLDNA